MTYEQIEKEFDERFTPDWWKGFGVTDDIDKMGIEGIKSFLKQSFIKCLQGEVEKWIKIFDYHSDMSNKRHSTMRNVARTEIETLQAQIKSLEV